jgi:hypothetical protein
MTVDKIEQIVDEILEECVVSDEGHFWHHGYDSLKNRVNLGRPRAIALIRKLVEEQRDEAYIEGVKDRWL